MKNSFLRQRVIGSKWIPVPSIEMAQEATSVRTQRPWQAEFHAQIFGSEKENYILNAPTGSGKSNAICWTVHEVLKNNPSMKAIITVPFLVIGNGFIGPLDLACFDENNIHTWMPGVNLCKSTSSEESNVATIHKFLQSEPSIHDINQNILICSQASLVKAFEADNLNFKDVFVVVDEGHHVSHGENNLGLFTEYALENPAQNIKLMIVTATFFRTNQADIIPKEHLVDFERYNLAYDTYLKTCKYLESISYDFLLCEKTYEDALWSCFKEAAVPKTIVFAPWSYGNFSLGGKEKDVYAIYQAIAQSNKPVIREEADGRTSVKKGKQWIKILNLIDSEQQDKRKLLLDRANKEPEYIDVIIALRMIQEGADWQFASNEIIIGPRGSAVTLLQMVGRVLRDIKGKPHASIQHIIPYGLKQVSKDDASNYLKALMLTMLMEDVFVMPKLRVKTDGTTLGEMLNGNLTLAQDVLGGITASWAAACEKNPDIKNNETVYTEVAKQVLSDLDITEDQVKIAEKVWDMNKFQAYKNHVKKTKSESDPKVNLGFNNLVDVSEIDFDVLNELDSLGGYRGGLSGDILSLFRTAYGNIGEEEAINNLRRILTSYSSLPSSYAEINSQEFKDSRFLINKRQGKNGNKTHSWYPILDEIALEFGIPKLFDNYENRSVQKFLKIIETYKVLENIPKLKSNDKQEKSDAQWLATKRHARNNLDSKESWYPMLQEIAVKNGWNGIWDSENEKFEKKANELKNWLLNNNVIKLKFNSNNPEELYWYNWIDWQRQLKAKKSRTYNVKIEEILGPDLFKFESKEEKRLKSITKFCDWSDKNGKKIPVYNSIGTEKTLYNWMQRLISAKRGFGKQSWYPEIEEYCLSRGYDLFS